MVNSEKRIEITTYVLYAVANFLIILNPGAFWDDWALYGMNSDGIMSQFKGNGITVFGYLHIFLKSISGSPILYHCLTFLLQLLLVFTLFRIIFRVVKSQQLRIFFSYALLLFAVFPHYDSKITMIVFPYTLCLTLFVLGTYFLFRFRDSRNIIYRILSLTFFFFSFFTNSLLFFYVLPLFFCFIYEHFNFPLTFDKIKNWFIIILKRLDFFLLPVIFWIIRLLFFMPSQQYSALGYNEIKLETLFQIPYRIIVLGYIFIKDFLPFIYEASGYLELWAIFIILIILSYFILSKINLHVKVSWKLLAWGIVIFLIGAFPYLMVNKYPTYIDYFSRHQLLVGFGASLTFCSIIFLLESVTAKRVLLALSMGAFVVLNIFLQFSFFKGYVKQEVYQDFFARENISSTTSKTILLEDDTADFTKKGNPVKFYAFAGMLKQLNEKENILLIKERTLQHFVNTGLFEMIEPYNYQYNLSDYAYTPPSYKLVVDYSEEKQPDFPLMTYYSQFFSGEKDQWNQYFTFELIPIEYTPDQAESESMH